MNARAARSRRAARMAKAGSKFAPPGPESALWSAFGYDTVCLFWGLPVRVFRALSEAERQGMVRVSNRIDDMSATDREPVLREIGRSTPRLGYRHSACGAQARVRSDAVGERGFEPLIG